MPRPEDLSEYRRRAEWALVAATALEAGLFEALSEGPSPAVGLARRLGLDARATATLLGALEPLGLVRREGEAWRLTGAGRGHLVDRETPDFQGDSLRHWLRNLRRWTAELPSVVRHGREEGAGGPIAGPPDEEALPRFMAAMANKREGLVEEVVDIVLSRAVEAATLLDLGGGPGSFARAFARRGLRVTLFDRPEVIEHVGPAYGLAGEPSIELVAGDFLENLPEISFDVVLAANVTHIFSAETNADLIRRAARQLRPGGLLALLDFVRGRSDFAALFAITMLLNTESGGTYSLDEYGGWMRAAGLEAIECTPAGPDAHVVSGRRPRAGTGA